MEHGGKMKRQGEGKSGKKKKKGESDTSGEGEWTLRKENSRFGEPPSVSEVPPPMLTDIKRNSHSLYIYI